MRFITHHLEEYFWNFFQTSFTNKSKQGSWNLLFMEFCVALGSLELPMVIGFFVLQNPLKGNCPGKPDVNEVGPPKMAENKWELGL